ncbi:MAG TPA: flagellar motor switch protein FliN, partial [Idiomarina loihiensis]|nr:flagellar motor switch protein FliN [Idiomarina loihiensis]
MSNDDKDMDDWEAAMAEQEAAEDEESGESGAGEGAGKSSSHSGMDNVQTAELEELSE